MDFFHLTIVGLVMQKILIIPQIEFQMMKYESFIGGIYSQTQSSWEPQICSFLYPLQPNNNFLNQTISNFHSWVLYYAFFDVCQYTVATFWVVMKVVGVEKWHQKINIHEAIKYPAHGAPLVFSNITWSNKTFCWEFLGIRYWEQVKIKCCPRP